MSEKVYVLLARYDCEGDQLICVAKDLKTAKRIGNESRAAFLDQPGSTGTWKRDNVDPNVWELDASFGTSYVICREPVL